MHTNRVAALMTTRQQLIERLEKATGPDRELDEAIWLATTPGATFKLSHVNHPKGPYDIRETRDATHRLVVVPEYTASAEEALMLAPEGCRFYRWSQNGKRWSGEIHLPNFSGIYKVSGCSLAIAFCVAALKAGVAK